MDGVGVMDGVNDKVGVMDGVEELVREGEGAATILNCDDVNVVVSTRMTTA